MGQGNPNKVNAIVDEIVKSNSVFKLKSPIEQDKEKDSMARSINSALSVLNEVGKELVLQDLSVDPDEKFKGFIDSVGNIDISGLTKMTATIVKAKIEEAEREGLNLRTGEPVFKNDSKISVVEGVLTLAVVNEMINNFENLTPEERGFLRNNYEHLTSEQRSKYDKGMLDKIENSKLDDKTKKDLTDFFEGDFHSSINIILNILQKNLGIENFNLSKISQSEILKIIENLDIPKELKDKLKKYDFEKLLSIDKSEQKLADLYIQRDLAERNENLEEVEKLDKLIKQYKSSPEHKAASEIKETSKETEKKKEDTKGHDSAQSQKKINTELQNHSQGAFSEQSKEQTEKSDIPQTISQEIEQLPIALVKANFSQEEIKTNLSIYTNFLSRIDSNEISQLSTWSPERLSSFLSGAFNKFGMNEQMAGILSKINFSGKLFDILGNEEQKKEFFEQFDRVINQEHIQNRHEPLTGELEQIFSQYFQDNAVDMNVSAIEAQQKHLTEEKQQDGQAQQPEEQKVDSSLSVTEIRVAPEEHTQESATNPEQETLEETGQNMAMVELDNSFIGKIRRAMSKIKSSIKTKVSKFFGKNENITEEDKKTSSEQVETTTPKLHNTLDRYTIENNHIEENAFKDFKDNEIVPAENESDKELGD